MAQPQPGELDQGCPQARVAGLGHTLLVIDRSALPGRRRQARVGGHLPAVVEVSEQALRPEDGGELRTDALDVEQHRRRRWRHGLSRGKQRVTLGLDRLDLLEQQFEPIELAADLRLQMQRQRTAVARCSSSSRRRRSRRSGS